MITEVYKGAPDTPELYVPQRHMLEAVDVAREAGISECYVDVATGVGKTYAVAHDIKKYLDEKPDARVLYLCHKGQVLEQARETIKDVVDSKVSHGNFYKNQCDTQEQVTYATFQQMAGKSNGAKNYQAFDPKEFDYIVVDESHHGSAPTYAEVIEYFDPDFQIGLTATDERMDGKDISEVLGPKVFEYTLEEAIAEGVLVKPDYRLFTEHEADLKDLLDDEDMPPTLKDINDRLTKVQRDRNYQKAIVGEIQAAQAEHADPRTVIYCPDIQYAEDFSELIPEGQTLHSALTDEEQDERLKAFRKGEIPTLLVVDIFNEGIDVPEINTMVFLRGTESKMIFLQQLGRGLRTAEGKDKVIALDFAASWQRIMLIAELKDKVQTIYRDRAPSFVQQKTGKRPKREYFDSDDMVPFEFNFSKDALDAVNIVEKIRREKSKPKKIKNKGLLIEKRNNADKALQDMFGLGPYDPSDPHNPHNLPNQRLTKFQEDMYARKIAFGDKDAQQQYIMHRLRYIYGRALTEYEKQPNAGNLDIEDYFQKGLEGLTHLLNEYDIKTHKQHPDIRRYVAMRVWNNLQKLSTNESTQIRIPIHVQEQAKKVQNARKDFIKKSNAGRDPLDAELVEAIEDSSIQDIDDIERIKPLIDMLENGPDNVDDLSPAQDENANVLHEVSIRLGEKKIIDLLERFSSKERAIIVNRYGLAGESIKAVEVVAKDLSISAARVREIENEVLRKLAKNPESMEIRDAFNDTYTNKEHLAQSFPDSMPTYSVNEQSIISGLYNAYYKLQKSQAPKVWEEIRGLEGRLRAERRAQEIQSAKPWPSRANQKWSKNLHTLHVKRRQQLWKNLKLENAPEGVIDSLITNIESLEMAEGLSKSLHHANKLLKLMNSDGPSSHRQVRQSRKDLKQVVQDVEDKLNYLRSDGSPTFKQLSELRNVIIRLNGSVLRSEYALSNINRMY